MAENTVAPGVTPEVKARALELGREMTDLFEGATLKPFGGSAAPRTKSSITGVSPKFLDWHRRFSGSIGTTEAVRLLSHAVEIRYWRERPTRAAEMRRLREVQSAVAVINRALIPGEHVASLLLVYADEWPDIRARLNYFSRAVAAALEDSAQGRTTAIAGRGRRSSPKTGIACRLALRWHDVLGSWPSTRINGPFHELLAIAFKNQGVAGGGDWPRIMRDGLRWAKETRAAIKVKIS